MSKVTVTVKFDDADDWIALYYRRAPEGATRFTPADAADWDEWNPVEIRGRRGEIDDEPGLYFYGYEAGNTTGNHLIVKFIQGDDVLKANITLGSGISSWGGNLFYIR